MNKKDFRDYVRKQALHVADATDSFPVNYAVSILSNCVGYSAESLKMMEEECVIMHEDFKFECFGEDVARGITRICKKYNIAYTDYHLISENHIETIIKMMREYNVS